MLIENSGFIPVQDGLLDKIRRWLGL
jgi:hypothetical protein